MALIYCKECNGMVSTLAEMCPHCGCPIAKIESTVCVIHGNEYDLKQVLDFALQGDTPQTRLHGGAAIRRITGLAGGDSGRLWDEIIKTKKVPQVFRTKNEAHINTTSIPKCPTCGSTNLTKKGIGARAIDGFFFGRLSVEGRSQFRCENCGYEF